MATKTDKKNEIRRDIIESAGIYSISTMVNAPILDYQQNVKYYEVFSNHGGAYNDSSFRHNGLRTLVD